MGSHRFVLALVVVFGCAHHDDGPGADGGVGTGVKSLSISPPQATVALTAAGAGYTASQAFTVTALYADGTTADVTSDIQWGVDDSTAVSFSSATATVIAAGESTITATLTADATVTATLDATLNSTGFGPGFDPGDQSKLDG